MSYPTRVRSTGTPTGPPYPAFNPSILTPAPTRTGNPIGRPSNALIAARQAAAALAQSQGLPSPSVVTARTMGRPPPAPRQGSTPVPTVSQPPAAQMKVYHRQPTHPPGPLPLYLAPPGQPTLDSTLTTPARSQGMYSTYPSRMRTGVTTLIQPETITGGPRKREAFMAEYERELAGGSGASTPRYDSPRPTFRPTVSGISGRRGRAINYADKASDDESESSLSELDDAASDPEDDNYGGGGKRAREADKRAREKKEQPLDMLALQRMSRLKRKKDDMEKGWTWLGERPPGERVTSVGIRGGRHKYHSEEQLEEADAPEMLIPITIDLDVAGRTAEQANIKVRDRFLWNVNDTLLDPASFASALVSDLSIPSENIGIIADLIRTQIEEAQGITSVDIQDSEAVEDEITFDEGDDKDDGVAEDEQEAWQEADCRVILNLDLQIFNYILRDRIEWDLSSPLPPSLFAISYARELGLSSEAAPLISHALTEEIFKHKKDALDLRLFRSTHPTEQAKWEKTPGLPMVNNRQGAKGLKGVWRDWFEREEYGPVLLELTFEEMERREVERNREQRRIMRGLIGKRRR